MILFVPTLNIINDLIWNWLQYESCPANEDWMFQGRSGENTYVKGVLGIRYVSPSKTKRRLERNSVREGGFLECLSFFWVLKTDTEAWIRKKVTSEENLKNIQELKVAALKVSRQKVGIFTLENSDPPTTRYTRPEAEIIIRDLRQGD